MHNLYFFIQKQMKISRGISLKSVTFAFRIPKFNFIHLLLTRYLPLLYLHSSYLAFFPVKRIKQLTTFVNPSQSHLNTVNMNMNTHLNTHIHFNTHLNTHLNMILGYKAVMC